MNFPVKACSRKIRGFLFGSEDEMPNLGMAFALLMNQFCARHFALVDFKVLSKANNAYIL